MNTKEQSVESAVISETESSETAAFSRGKDRQGLVPRRSFLKGLGIAGVALSAGGLVTTGARAATSSQGNKKLSKGDVAILKLWLRQN
jgi:hypothetical protein